MSKENIDLYGENHHLMVENKRLKSENKKLLLDKEELQYKFSLYVVVSSNMRKALETVVKGYESDGMENMQIRDDVFYKTCKEALDLGK